MEQEANTMKFSEAVAKIEDNPNLKFECITKDDNKRMVLRANTNGYLVINTFTYETRALISSDLAKGRFNGNIHINSDWTQIIESVDFMTAINSGKRIKPAGSTDNFMTVRSLSGYMLGHKYKSEQEITEAINGTWEIEQD